MTHVLKLAFFVCLIPGMVLCADEDASGQGSTEGRRWAVGLRVEYDPLHLFELSTQHVTTTVPQVGDVYYYGSSNTPRTSVAPTFEYRLTPHITLDIELQFQHAEYSQETQIRYGPTPASGATDDRPITTVTQTTTANYWVVPLLARYYGIRKTGRLRRAYLTGGLELRHVGKMPTGNDFAFSDGTTNYNEVAAKPDWANAPGVAVGFGFRFIDEFHIKVAPEARYVRWLGTSIQGISYKSNPGQVEAGLGISF